MSLTRFPWSWVEQHGVLLESAPDSVRLVLHPGTALTALAEALRVEPDASLTLIDTAEFMPRAAAHYQPALPANPILGQALDLRELVEALPEDNDLLDSEDGAPVIRLINAILLQAVREGASDIHLEPFEKQLSVRFRIDGILRPILAPPVQLARYLISRIKVMARLDIAEKRLPQDGRISLRLGGRHIDVRVSTLPSRFGERVVLRVLDKNAQQLSLAHIGMHATLRDTLCHQLALPHGIILVTGPTGSGKSTSLYAALRQLWSPEKNILTIEDPVEYELEGVGQTQVNARVEMTFARGLRAILRQDPDIVMIGEIRDGETAQIAVQASLTGHLVLSTLHTNTALGAIERLRDMGVEPFLLANALSAVLAQRLVRKLCAECRQLASEQTLPAALAAVAEPPESAQLYRAVGCDSCRHTGYRGRTAIHELVVMDASLRAAISRGESEQALQQRLSGQRRTLLQDGIDKVLAGITTGDEVLRVSREVP
ncbi:type II secretion system ATPase GspE [Pantoea sp. 1.19]|uniref:type II secretion system ATPase GspE n=1 Tax=Pantoea sp. 1.19 TaxID=1925589 RepID=UPI00094916E3|nr:type II secretion system ATPase GspE [Pantoea sp. 1.19]